MRRWMLPLLAVLCVGGCSSARYTGAEPFVTSFKDDPGWTVKDYYYGMNADFVLDEPGKNLVPDQQPPIPAPVPAAEPPEARTARGGSTQ